MASNFKRETMATEQILESIDSGDRTVMVIKDTPTASPISFTGNVPFWQIDLHDVPSPDQDNSAAEPLVLAEMEKMRIRLSRLRAAMPYARRHIDADEIHFIHSGRAKIYTEVGEIDAPTGRFIFIGRGIGYRIVPETDDFMDYYLESEENVEQTESWELTELKPIYPTVPMKLPESDGQTEWQERLVTRSWSADVKRSYDPVRSKQVVGAKKPVFAVDAADIPASSPKAPIPGVPFELFSSPVLAWDISKRVDPLPFYHRNNRRNEVEFVHTGNGDQDTDLGYLPAPPGTFYNLPRGIEHSPMNRKGPLVCLIFETTGDVDVNPDILKK